MTEEFSTRKLEPIDTETRFSSADPQYWAIIVGISEYKHGAWNLQYAHRDAEELYKQLLQLKGARFQDKQIVKLFNEKRICKLVNQEATTAHITDALREFLKKPEKDDIVFLFFACHGTPDPDRTENLYLLTYDTDPERIAGSALPMREIRDAVKETLAANKVIILADTCHSGGLSFSGLRNIEGTTTTRINTYLQNLQQASDANVIFTSAEKNQMSREGAQWGGGHGIFTHYLLEGMRGKADQDQDGIVTLGELLEYVRSRVKEDTDNKQHPSISIASNRCLPIAIIDESSAVAAKAIAAMESTFAPRQSHPEGHSSSFEPGANRDVVRQPTNAAPKKNVLWILSVVGVCLTAIMTIFAANHQPEVGDPPTSDPTPLPSTVVDPGILKDYEIRIYYPLDRSALELKANEIRDIFSEDFRENNVKLFPQPKSFFDQYNYPNTSAMPPGNELRYTAPNVSGAKYLEEILREQFPSETFYSLPIGSAEGKYVSVFIGP